MITFNLAPRRYSQAEGHRIASQKSVHPNRGLRSFRVFVDNDELLYVILPLAQNRRAAQGKGWSRSARNRHISDTDPRKMSCLRS
eukprot:g4057.t1